MQNLVKKFNTVYERQKVKVNVRKGKVTGFEREKCDAVEFSNPHRMSAE